MTCDDYGDKLLEMSQVEVLHQKFQKWLCEGYSLIAEMELLKNGRVMNSDKKQQGKDVIISLEVNDEKIV